MKELENYKKMFPTDHEYFKEWLKIEHIEQKEEYFQILDTYCRPTPTSILDIGCGLAFESRAFNRKYGTELYLLDGDFYSNRETNLRRKDFGPKKNMMYYTGLQSLKNFLTLKRFLIIILWMPIIYRSRRTKSLILYAVG